MAEETENPAPQPTPPVAGPEPKPVSRQRRWQIKQVAKGLCSVCGRKRKHYTQLCDVCNEIRTRRVRWLNRFHKRKKGGVGRPPFTAKKEQDTQ